MVHGVPCYFEKRGSEHELYPECACESSSGIRDVNSFAFLECSDGNGTSEISHARARARAHRRMRRHTHARAKGELTSAYMSLADISQTRSFVSLNPK